MSILRPFRSWMSKPIRALTARPSEPSIVPDMVLVPAAAAGCAAARPPTMARDTARDATRRKRAPLGDDGGEGMTGGGGGWGGVPGGWRDPLHEHRIGFGKS